MHQSDTRGIRIHGETPSVLGKRHSHCVNMETKNLPNFEVQPWPQEVLHSAHGCLV